MRGTDANKQVGKGDAVKLALEAHYDPQKLGVRRWVVLHIFEEVERIFLNLL